MDKFLKGDTFFNRIRFTGTLTTLSPLHIGTGITSKSRVSRVPKGAGKDAPADRKEPAKEAPKDTRPEVALVMKDFDSKPLLPGSSLRGVMRHWLHSVLVGFGDEWAYRRDFEAGDLQGLDQSDQIDLVREEFSWLELLFGTPFHEGKVEVWDAPCKTPSLKAPDKLLDWHEKSLTYVDTSVAIDPETGTALDKLLYSTEIAPKGLDFEFNLVGQNLSDLEIGLILLALQGFNSEILPISIGARTGRGYGRMRFKPGPVYALRDTNLKAWVTGLLGQGDSLTAGPAGYYVLPQLSGEDQAALVAKAKATLLSEIGR